MCVCAEKTLGICCYLGKREGSQPLGFCKMRSRSCEKCSDADMDTRLYSFAVAAVGKPPLFSYRSGGEESNVKVSTVPCSLWRLQGIISFLAFFSFWREPVSLGSWPPPTPSKLAAKHLQISVSLTSASALTAHSLRLRPSCLPLIFTIRTHLDNAGSSPHFKIRHLITSAKSLLPREVTYSQFPRIRMWTSWERGVGIAQRL